MRNITTTTAAVAGICAAIALIAGAAQADEPAPFETYSVAEKCAEIGADKARWRYTCYRFPGQSFEVTTIIPRNVADGSIHSRDNLTSMGFAVSDGATILRLRSTQEQDVHLRKAGGGTETVSVGIGDTFVAVPGPGTYIATFVGSGRKVTKATGPQDWQDVFTETGSRDMPKYRQFLLTEHLRD